MPELIGNKRKVWNPLARYYVEPAGEWIAEKMKGSWITPNMISIANTIVGILMGLFILEGSWLSLIIWGVWVRFYHMWDVVDGHLARFSNLKTTYGGFIDAIGGRLVMGVWPVFMLVRLYLDSGNLAFVWWGVAFFFGLYMYMTTSMKGDLYYRQADNDERFKSVVKGSAASQAFLFFIDGDIQYHMMTLAAFLNRLDLYIYFYAIYFNVVWLSYVGFYSLRWMRSRT